MRRSMIAWIGLSSIAALLFGFTLASGVGAQGADDDPGQVEAGQAVYESSCAGCHGADGAGTERGRPLIGIASQQPDRSHHVASVTDGKGNMPAFGDRLDADEIDAAISYVRLTFVEEAAQSGSDSGGDSPGLALTGTETAPLAVGGLALVAAGALLTHHASRLRRRAG